MTSPRGTGAGKSCFLHPFTKPFMIVFNPTRLCNAGWTVVDFGCLQAFLRSSQVCRPQLRKTSGDDDDDDSSSSRSTIVISSLPCRNSSTRPDDADDESNACCSKDVNVQLEVLLSLSLRRIMQSLLPLLLPRMLDMSTHQSEDMGAIPPLRVFSTDQLPGCCILLRDICANSRSSFSAWILALIWRMTSSLLASISLSLEECRWLLLFRRRWNSLREIKVMMIC